MRNNFTRHFLNYFVAADFRTSAETVFAPLMRTGTQPRTVRTDARRKVAVLLGVRRADADAGGRTLRGIDGVSSVGGLESERSPAPRAKPCASGRIMSEETMGNPARGLRGARASRSSCECGAGRHRRREGPSRGKPSNRLGPDARRWVGVDLGHGVSTASGMVTCHINE